MLMNTIGYVHFRRHFWMQIENKTEFTQNTGYK